MSRSRFAEKESKTVGPRAKVPQPPTKLRIGDPHDALEREANRVAKEAAGSGNAKLNWSLSNVGIGAPLQRKCSCGNSSNQGECEECKQKSLQRRDVGTSEQGMAPPIVHEVLRSPGQPLDQQARAQFEPRFGHDFSEVRVHTDGRAAESARSVNALAYTVGKDIVFGKSQFAPETAAGQDLLAHELAHTIQQNAHASGTGLQRQTDVDELEDQGNEAPANEPHDGDMPVITSAAPQAEEGVGGKADDGTDLGVLAQNTPEEMQGGGKGDKDKSKDKPKDKPKEKKDDKKPAAPLKITDIDVDLSSQQMTVHYSDGSTEGHAISSGKGLPGTKDDPCKTQKEENCTPTGDFKIVSKGNKDTKNQHDDKMAWYVELGGDKVIDGRGIGIHNSQPVGGGPRSHGCVRVGDTAADEAFAKKINKGVDDKTVVHITGKAATKPYPAPTPKKKPASKPKEKKK